MARRTQAYAFSTETDLDISLKAQRIVLGINQTNAQRLLSTKRRVWVKVDVGGLRAGSDDKRAKCTEVVPDASTGDYAVPTGSPWIFDSDNLSNDYTTTDVYSMVALEEEEVIEVELVPDKSETYQWLAIKQGGVGSSLVYIEITASTNISTYTGTIYDNPIDRNIVESGVTVRAMQHDAGTIPNSDPGKGFTCVYNKDNDVYFITNYSVAYGS